jgi:uncharacterized protein (TIGR03435 family)
MQTPRSLWLAGFAALFLSLAGSKPLGQERPSFEVASVKPAPEFRGLPPSVLVPPRDRPGGRFDATARLRDLIGWAFKPQISAIEGTFRELDDVFVIAAKAAEPSVRSRPGTATATFVVVRLRTICPCPSAF